MNADGTGQVRLTQNTGDYGHHVWSPDGSRIAFVRSGDIYVMNADGTEQTRLTNGPGANFSPAWSPDGTKIAYEGISWEPERTQLIYVMNADGTGRIRLTSNRGGPWESDASPRWSPDGSRIAFTADRDENISGPERNPEIYVVNADGTGEINLTSYPWRDESPAWSPDGTKIAFTSNRWTSESEIYVMNADGTGQTQLTFTDCAENAPAWSPDGKQIAFAYDLFTVQCQGSDVVRGIYTMNADGSNLTAVTSLPGSGGVAWKP